MCHPCSQRGLRFSHRTTCAPPGILEESLQEWPAPWQAHTTAAANELLASPVIPTLPTWPQNAMWLPNCTCPFWRFTTPSAYAAQVWPRISELEVHHCRRASCGGGVPETRLFLVVFQSAVRSPSLRFVFGFFAARGFANSRSFQARTPPRKKPAALYQVILQYLLAVGFKLASARLSTSH